MPDNEMRVKAWCFDNGVSLKQLENAWNNAIDQGHARIMQFQRSGMSWMDLNTHLLPQLLEQFGGNNEK